MSENTARFQLPFIMPGQAQKELYHNEALVLMDALLHAAVETLAEGQAPAQPVEGQCWIVASGAGGPWQGHGDDLAAWTDGGWRFIPPKVGMWVWNKATGYSMRWTGTAWSDGGLPVSRLEVGGQQVVGARCPAVLNPSGGTVIDVEARAALGQVIAALMSHGLIG